MKNKRALIIALYTILFLSITVFASYPATYSKYISKSNTENNLKYLSKLLVVPENQTKTLSAPTINGDFANFKFSITPNPTAYGVNDNYSIIVPSGCYAGNYSVSFKETDERKNINLNVSCNIENITNNDNMSVTITVIEKIIRPNTTGWTPPFRYAEYVYEGTYIKPAEEPSIEDEPTVDEPNIPEESINEQVLNYLLATDEKYNTYKDEIASYLSSEDLTLNTLPGLNINNDIYEVDANFLGYARTYHENKNNLSRKVMIFSNLEKESINQTFAYYLEKYYKESNLELTSILEYANSQNDISSIILENNYISGFNYQDGKLTISDNINTYASLTKEILTKLENDPTIIPEQYIVKDSMLIETNITNTYTKISFADIVVADKESNYNVSVIFNDSRTLNEIETLKIKDLLELELNLDGEFSPDYEVITNENNTTIIFEIIKNEVETPDPGDTNTPTVPPDETEEPESPENPDIETDEGAEDVTPETPDNSENTDVTPPPSEPPVESIPEAPTSEIPESINAPILEVEI